MSVEEEEDVAKFKDFTLESAEGGAGGANIEPEATPEPVKEEPVTEAVEPAVPAAPATKIEPTPSKAPVSPAPSTMSDVTVEYEEIPMSKFRKITAARLTESKQTIPHVYLSIDCCIDEMAARRAIINSKLGEGESKVSVNDFVLKACAKALQQVHPPAFCSAIIHLWSLESSILVRLFSPQICLPDFLTVGVPDLYLLLRSSREHRPVGS